MSNDATGDVGIDVKYGVTQNLTADLTYNTDFAQVEADTQQINLTRFSLFFPEKREFFLENAGTFAFGASGNNFTANADTPLLFYSRRIGLEGGRAVPIDGGTRHRPRWPLQPRPAEHSAGDDELAVAATNFSVVRLKRDLLRRSSVGLMATGRREGSGGAGNNLRLRRRRHVCVLREPGDQHLLGADRYKGGDRAGHELSGPARLRRRPLRRAARSSRRRRQLQPGRRVRPPDRHAADARAGAVQSAPAREHDRPQVFLDRHRDAHRGRRGARSSRASSRPHSGSTSRMPIGSILITAATTSCCRRLSALRRASRSRRAGTGIETCASVSPVHSCTASPAACPPSTARSTTATKRRSG